MQPEKFKACFIFFCLLSRKFEFLMLYVKVLRRFYNSQHSFFRDFWILRDGMRMEEAKMSFAGSVSHDFQISPSPVLSTILVIRPDIRISVILMAF